MDIDADVQRRRCTNKYIRGLIQTRKQGISKNDISIKIQSQQARNQEYCHTDLLAVIM